MVANESKPEYELLFDSIKSLRNILVIAFVCIFLGWYIQYHWNRRKLYKMAAKANGPLALPFIGNMLNAEITIHETLNNIQPKKWKSPFRLWLGPWLCFAIDELKDVETVLTRTLHKDFPYKLMEEVLGTGLLTAQVPKWKKHRKLIMPAFNQKVLDGFVEIFAEKSNIFCEVLEKESGKGPFDIFDYFALFTLDTVCQTVMGVNVNAQTTSCNYFKWAKIIKEAIQIKMYNVFYHIKFIYKRTKLYQIEKHALESKNQFILKIITDKKKQLKSRAVNEKAASELYSDEKTLKRNSLLQHLLESSLKGATLTDEEIREEVDIFVIAGSDTAALTLGFVFKILGMYPDIQEKVYQEVIEITGKERSVQYRDLIQLTYLERVIKETMRLFPIVPYVARAVTDDIQLDNFLLPEGSSVIVPIAALHRDPTIWPDSLKFDPDRFLPEEVAKRHPYSWIPFGGGPRNCIGSKYAMMVMKCVIATITRKYKISADYNTIEQVELKLDVLLQSTDGFKVSLNLR